MRYYLLILSLFIFTTTNIFSQDSSSAYNKKPEDLLFLEVNDSLLADTVSELEKRAFREITVKAPSARNLDPNTFPTFVFLIYNNSDTRQDLNFKVFLPENWEKISFRYPSFIEPHNKERARITFIVPKAASADSTYMLGLITSSRSYADTSFTEMNINPRPAIRLMTFIEEKTIIPGKVDSLTYVVQNNGNITDTIFIKAEIPADWEIIKLIDRLILSSQNNYSGKLLFKSPESTSPDITNSITLTATSLAAKKKGIELTDKRTVRIKAIKIKKREVRESLYPFVPINVGFAIRRIEKGKYPEIQIFATTESIDLGNYSTQLELTQKLQSAPVDQTPKPVTERVKFKLASKNWNILLGDVLVESNPLMNKTGELALTGYQPSGELGRGCRIGYKFDKANLSLFRGKRLYYDYSITSALADYRPSDKLELSSSYICKKETHLVTMEGVFDTKKSRSFGALAGLSKSNKSNTPIAGALQLRAITKINSVQLLGRIHTAGRSYTGSERGKYGAVISSKWLPKSYLYLWGSYHAYKQNLSMTTRDSSVFVHNIRTRSFLHYKDLPTMNIGLNFRRELYSNGYKGGLNSIDLRIRKQLQYGMPTLYFKLDDKLSPIYEDKQKRYELRAEWISYFKRSRIKLDQGFIRSNSSPIGYISGIDMNFAIRDIPIGFLISRGKVWTGSKEQGYRANKISNIGIRSNFGVKAFGQSFNVRIDISKQSYEDNRFLNDWRILVSLSSSIGKASRFYVPVPFIKTKGVINGEIFIDKNGNGIRDVNEAGIPQIMLFLKDENALSDSDGKFEFPPLEPGEYPFSVDIATLPAYLSILKEIPEYISIRKGSEISLQIPITSICSINGHVFLDVNTNYKFDPEEKGISTIRVVIQNEKGQEWEAYTNRDGYYTVPDLLPGIYSIMIDSRWLPKRIIPGKKDYTFMLTPNAPHQIKNLSAVKKKLEIRKTFIAPKDR